MTFPNARDCEHGSQRGRCELCDANEEVVELKTALEAEESKCRELQDEANRLRRGLETARTIFVESGHVGYARACDTFLTPNAK